MFGMMVNPGLLRAPNVWKLWVEHILKQKDTLGLRKAALLHHDGNVAYASSGFALDPHDVQKLEGHLEGTRNSERVSLNGKTYIIKDVDQKHMVAFNGAKYYIIAKSKTMYIVSVCESRSKVNEAVVLIKKLARRLVEKDY